MKAKRENRLNKFNLNELQNCLNNEIQKFFSVVQIFIEKKKIILQTIESLAWI